MRQNETDRVFDELLVTLVRAGDRRAAARLAARWQPRLLRAARRILRDDELAREAVQDAWAGICRGWLALSDPAKFPAWAFGVLHRKCADRLRGEIRRRERLTSLDGVDVPAPAPRADIAIAIDRALAALSADHRAAATLYYGEGLTLAEIAAATGVPQGTAKSRLFYARRQLKAALEGDES